jgi:LuxR family maltose regulon positive regulatory protein
MWARVLIAQKDPSTALTVLEPQRKQAEAKGATRKLLDVMTAQSLAFYTHGEKEKAVNLLGEALALAEPNGLIRLFVDEGEPMAELLTKVKAESGKMKEYIHTLLTAFGDKKEFHPSRLHFAQAQVSFIHQPLVEPLSQRELEILKLIAQGLSNREIGERLFLALDTVKGHNRKIFDKLQVQRRTEAIARARELGLL